MNEYDKPRLVWVYFYNRSKIYASEHVIYILLDSDRIYLIHYNNNDNWFGFNKIRDTVHWSWVDSDSDSHYSFVPLEEILS